MFSCYLLPFPRRKSEFRSKPSIVVSIYNPAHCCEILNDPSPCVRPVSESQYTEPYFRVNYQPARPRVSTP